MNKKTIAAGAAAVAIASTIGLAGTASADSQCGPGATAKVHYENRVNPQTGKTERAKITECPDVKVSGDQGITTSAPAAGTGGLIFRDANGRDLGSGIGEEDQFEWYGQKKTLADGTVLIYVKQSTRGGGGWGSLYSGWVRAQFTQAPVLFK
ncbi:hypothetical protein SEA_KRADAL_19 [Streptomyces phage Kradal]|nr:hypothetical protein SEA_KRADAL_19 [Streptomyces phage Kradal]